MKILYVAAVLFLFACNQSTSKENEKEDSLATADSAKSIDSAMQTKNEVPDAVLVASARQILTLINAKDFYRLAEAIHPDRGLRFVTYGFVDTAKQQVLFANELLSLYKDHKTINWGTFDGSGDAINLSIEKYFNRFVYDVDFLHADTAVNRVVGNTAINNLKEFYPAGSFVQFYFAGVDPKYSGMDWKSLIVVFEKKNDRYYLVSLVHDQWKS